MNNQGGDLYYLDYSFASGIEDEKEKAACNQAASPLFILIHQFHGIIITYSQSPLN